MNEFNTPHVHSVIKCMCLYMYVSLVKFSSDLTELDLGENHIGEAGGKELLEALKERKAGVDFLNVLMWGGTDRRFLAAKLPRSNFFIVTIVSRPQ